MYLLLASDYANDYHDYFLYIFIFPVVTFYTLFFESIWNGQTPGKRILKIKVIKLNGKQPVFYDYLIRWTFRIIDVGVSGGVVGTILIASTDYAQRLGDMTSNSAVVRVNNRMQIALNDILKINTRQNYEPTYHRIANFREDDILLIKQTIERYQRYRNEAHKKAVLMLCENLKQRLELQDIGPDKIKFLKTLIKDYIVLTR
jgi:RDD family